MGDRPAEDKFSALRQRAEEALQRQPANLADLSPADIQALIHNLQVHQIELELQNEELRRTQLELQAARDRYADLYNFAPVGYFTLDANGAMVEANLTGAALLSMPRSSLIGAPLTPFVIPEDRDKYASYRVRLGAGQEPQVTEVRLISAAGALFFARLDGLAVHDHTGHLLYCKLTISDISALKQAEAALSEQQAMLQSFYDSAPFLMGIAKLAGDRMVVVSSNRLAAEFFAMQPEELPGKTGNILGNSTDLERLWVENCRRSQQDRAPVHFDYEYPRAAGACWLSATVTFIGIGPTGNPRFSFVVEDVTKRKRSEAVLRAAHDTFRQLVENSPFGIYVVDADFRLAQVGAGAQKVFENVRPLIGRDFAEVLRVIWPEPFASETIARFRHTLATGEPYHAPSTIERRSDIGEIEAYDWKIERITLPDERFGVVCHFYDLSERQRFEASLRESEERLRLAIETAEMFSWECDLPQQTIKWSENTARLFGCAPEALPADLAHSQFFVAPDDAGRITQEFAEFVRQGATHYTQEFRGREAGDQTRYWRTHALVLYNAGGTPVRVIGITQNITGHKQIEMSERLLAEMSERNRLAQELHDTVAQALGYLNLKIGIAHASLANNEVEAAKAHLQELKGVIGETYNDVREEIFYLRAKVLSDLSFMELLERYIDKYRRFYNLDIHLLQEAEPALFQFSPEVTAHLIRTIQEALINIRKHARVNTATIRLGRANGELCISIEDAGQGFDLAQSQSKSSSFGLQIMRERVESVGGRLEIDTVPDQGTRIVLHYDQK